MQRQKMRELILTVGLIILSIVNSWSCVCDIKPEFKTKVDLIEYDFISLVRISKIDSIDSKAQPIYLSHQIEFDIIEKYKGETINKIIVSGGHWTLKNWTSCDLGENVNDEWIIFGYTNKRTNTLMTGMCTRTFRYKDSFGYRHKGYGNEITTIDKLRDIFEIRVDKPKYNGKHIEYYPNGQIELEEFYKNNKLNGQRLLWYPNGQLEGRQSFKNGKINGIAAKYSKTGQLLTREKFKDGYHIDTTVHWHEIDTSLFRIKIYTSLKNVTEDSAKKLFSSVRVSNKHIYNKKGELIYYCNYSQEGYLYSETIIDTKENKHTYKYYHDNGVLSSEMYRVNNLEFGIYKEWDKNGELTKSWEYDSNGKQIKESIKKYKD
jgi:antitoxin component YwqK of YwqJK toxin-antitoxin module